MTSNEFIDTILAAKSKGALVLYGGLYRAHGGVRFIAIRNLHGEMNGDTADMWIESRSGKRVLGHAFIGSRRNRKAELQGWPERIGWLAVPS